jgi:hypothetical protein
MKKIYSFKGFYKLLSIVSLIIMLIATILNAYLGDPITIVLLVATGITFLQYRRHSSPYIEIENQLMEIRYTWVRSFKVDIKEVVAIESGNTQIMLELDSGKKIGIYLGYLTPEDKKRALEDIPALVNDLSQHLTA